MVTVESIRDWRGTKVFDRDGNEIGELVEVYYDVESDTAAFVLVKSGFRGRHRRLVPLDGATVGRNYVRVRWTADTVSEIDVDEDTLASADEQAIYGHYGLAYARPDNRSGRRLVRR